MVCHAYAGPHDIVYNTTKTVCMLVQPKQLQGQYSTRVRPGAEELSFVDEFRYLGHVMTADSRDDMDIVKLTTDHINVVWPTCLQLDEQSNYFPQQYCCCHFQ